MSERVVYACDKCGATIAEGASVLSVNLALRGGGEAFAVGDGAATYATPYAVRHFCAGCRARVVDVLGMALHVEKGAKGDA